MENYKFQFSRSDEAFQSELVFNPYIQRMFQVCTSLSLSYPISIKQDYCRHLLDVRPHLTSLCRSQIQLWKRIIH